MSMSLVNIRDALNAIGRAFRWIGDKMISCHSCMSSSGAEEDNSGDRRSVNINGDVSIINNNNNNNNIQNGVFLSNTNNYDNTNNHNQLFFNPFADRLINDPLFHPINPLIGSIDQ